VQLVENKFKWGQNWLKVHEKYKQLNWVLTVFLTEFAFYSGAQRAVAAPALHAWLQHFTHRSIWSCPWSLLSSCCPLQIQGDIFIPGNCTAMSDLQGWGTPVLPKPLFKGRPSGPRTSAACLRKHCWGQSHAVRESRLPWSWWAAHGSCHPCCTWDPLAPRMRKVLWWLEISSSSPGISHFPRGRLFLYDNNTH